MSTAFENMDRMYRHQRYFYDVTRKFYLLGRDRLLRDLIVAAGDNVLEIGCGTGRNVAILAKLYADANFFGLDASSAMLDTADAKVRKAKLKNLTFKTALADDFSSGKTFGLDENFETIFFSYSISMIPVWRESIENALANLKPGGNLYIVDFYDQAGLPRPFQILLQSWLRQFGVQFWPDLISTLEELSTEHCSAFTVTPLFRRYSFIAKLTKACK